MTLATLLRAYHAAMSEARNNDQITNYHVDFMSRNKVPVLPTPPAGIKAIRHAHRDRVAGRGSPADCDTALNAALREIGQ